MRNRPLSVVVALVLGAALVAEVRTRMRGAQAADPNFDAAHHNGRRPRASSLLRVFGRTSRYGFIRMRSDCVSTPDDTFFG
jgi:hypothetical protein